MKTSNFNTLSIVFFLQFGLAASVSAAEEEKAHEKAGERVQHGTHEHGKAKLTMAKTDTGLEITMDSPSANIFGFGHPPGDDDERDIVQAAEKKLNAGDALFIPNSEASCKLKDVEIESTVISGYAKDEDHDGHDDHSSHDNEETHSDVEATWVFQCAKPKALKSVEVKLFSQFPQGFQHLNVEWITSKNAGTVELEANGSVKLK